MGPASDADLLREMARGDQEALRALYERYQRPLFGFCFRLVREAALAEDVVNDVFFEAWRGAGRFEGRSKPSTWLFGIAYHLAMNRLRSVRPPTVELETIPPMPSSDPDPASEAAAAERANRLHRALEGLSPEHRATVELAYARELSCEEVADALGIPVNTVKTRLFHARRRLRQLLSAEESGR